MRAVDDATPSTTRPNDSATAPRALARGHDRSWTSPPPRAELTALSSADLARERNIRAKLARGDALTLDEAGFLGALDRLRRAQRPARFARDRED